MFLELVISEWVVQTLATIGAILLVGCLARGCCLLSTRKSSGESEPKPVLQISAADSSVAAVAAATSPTTASAAPVLTEYQESESDDSETEYDQKDGSRRPLPGTLDPRDQIEAAAQENDEIWDLPFETIGSSQEWTEVTGLS
jgi:hypothetical protein